MRADEPQGLLIVKKPAHTAGMATHCLAMPGGSLRFSDFGWRELAQKSPECRGCQHGMFGRAHAAATGHNAGMQENPHRSPTG